MSMVHQAARDKRTDAKQRRLVVPCRAMTLRAICPALRFETPGVLVQIHAEKIAHPTCASESIRFVKVHCLAEWRSRIERYSLAAIRAKVVQRRRQQLLCNPAVANVWVHCHAAKERMSRASSVCALRTPKFLLIIFRLAAPRFTTPINLAGPTNLGLLQSPPREGMHMRLFALVAAGAILYLPLTVRSQTDTALKLSTSNPRA